MTVNVGMKGKGIPTDLMDSATLLRTYRGQTGEHDWRTYANDQHQLGQPMYPGAMTHSHIG